MSEVKSRDKQENEQWTRKMAAPEGARSCGKRSRFVGVLVMSRFARITSTVAVRIETLCEEKVAVSMMVERLWGSGGR